MRLAWPPPRHLIASVLLSLAALAMANLSPSSLQGILSPLSLILVLLIPGYLATLYIFPGKNDLSGTRRAFLCLTLSAILAGLFGLILRATPRGLESSSLATILSLLAIFLAAVAYGRWSSLPRNRRFLLVPKRGLGFTPPISRAALAILLLASCFIAALAFSFGPHFFSEETSVNVHTTASEEALSLPSSSFEVEKVQIKSYPLQEEVDYVADFSLNNSTNASIQAEVASSAAVNSTASNETKDKNEAFFSMGGGGGGGSTGGSSSSSSSQAAMKKPAADKAMQPENTASASLSPSGAVVSNVQGDTSVAANNLPNASSASLDNLTQKGNQTESSNSTENTNPTEGGNQTGSVTPTIEDRPSLTENLTADQAASPEAGGVANPEPLSSPMTEQGSAEPASAPSPDTNLSSNSALSEQPINLNESPIIDKSTQQISAETSAPSAAPSQSLVSQQSPTIETDLSRAIRQSEIDPAQLNERQSDNSNQPPVLNALAPDRASPQMQGSAIFWKAEAKDEEGDKILYKFFLDGREVRKWSKINSWSWLTQGLPAGDYLVTVLARDGSHAGEDSFDSMMNASFTLSRPNQAPVLQQLKPDRASPQGKGSIITWTASASDPDNDAIYYRFIKNDEAATDWSQSSSWVWDTSPEKPGEYRIAVQAKDGLHASKDASDSSIEDKFTLTEPNSIPEVVALNADRSSPQAAGSIITWTASAVDPDNDKISYKFLVNDNEASQWSSSNSWVWDTSSAAPGEYRIRALARDGSHSSEESFDSFKDSVMTIAAIDLNQPPTVSSLVSDIASPDVQGVTVIWNAEAQDPDGDKILYKFQLNGRDMGRWTDSASWKWFTKNLPPGDYKIRVLARDGKHAPENSFDSSRDAVFTLISEIDQQINQLMNKRKDASQSGGYQSTDIRVTSGHSTSSNAVLGKSNGTAGQDGAVTPRKLGN